MTGRNIGIERFFLLRLRDEGWVAVVAAIQQTLYAEAYAEPGRQSDHEIQIWIRRHSNGA